MEKRSRGDVIRCNLTENDTLIGHNKTHNINHTIRHI